MRQHIKDACATLHTILMAPPIEPAPVVALCGEAGAPVAMVVVQGDGQFALATRLYPGLSDRQRIESIEALRRTTQHFDIHAIVLPTGEVGNELAAFVASFKLPADVRTVKLDDRTGTFAIDFPNPADPAGLEPSARRALCLARCLLNPFTELSRFPPEFLLELPELSGQELDDVKDGLAAEVQRCREIIAEGDPRRVKARFRFADGVRELGDLKPGMKLPGIVTNVTDFGAFVNVGITQEGLVHISELRNDYVSTPADVVKPGEAVEVRVLTIDTTNQRVALSMRPEQPRRDRPRSQMPKRPQKKNPKRPPQHFQGNALGDAFGQLGL